jgi:hypothetical protein
VEVKLDHVSKIIANKMGYENVPWFKLTWYLLWIYTGLTLIVMLQRSDFINLTVCCIALFLMFNTQRITKNLFKVLVLSIIMTLVYDLIWFYLKHKEFSDESKNDGGLSTNLKRIVLMTSYISFLVRVSIVVEFTFSIDICGSGVLEGLNGF